MTPSFHPATVGDLFMAGLESMMLSKGQGRHFGVTVLRLESAPDLSALHTAWTDVYARHPVLSARLHRRFRGWQLGWRADAPLSAPAVVNRPDLHLSDGILRERLSGFVDGRPVVVPVHVEVFGSHHVVLTWRHGILDGVGINLLLEQLACGRVEAAEPVAAPSPRSPRELHQNALPVINVLKDMTTLGTRSAWERGRALAGAPGFRVIEFTPEQTQAAAGRCRRTCGDFFQMPFYAAVAARALRALHQLRGLPPAWCHMEVPFQSSKRGAGAVFQNRMGMLLLPLLESSLGTFEAAAAHVLAVYKDSVKKRLQVASEALGSLMMHFPARFLMPVIRLHNRGEICSLFHSHTGTFLRNVPDFAGAEVRNVYSIPSVSTPPGVGIFFSDHRGALTLTLAWRGESLNEGEVQAICGQILADLTAQ